VGNFRFVIFNNGSVIGNILRSTENLIEVEIKNQGIIFEDQRVTLSEHDKVQNDYDDSMFNQDIQFAIQNEVDYLVLNITKDETELMSLRAKIEEELEAQNKEYYTKIIAKLENEDAIKNLEGILEHADIIMVARGMLGTILPIEKISWI